MCNSIHRDPEHHPFHVPAIRLRHVHDVSAPACTVVSQALSHNYTQASLLTPYEIKMSTIVRDSALVNARRVRDQARYIADSLDELKAKQVLLNYQKKMVAGKEARSRTFCIR